MPANAIDLVFATEFETAAKEIVAQRARAVLITATGKHFCVGGDLKSFAQSEDLAATLAEVTARLHAGIASLVECDAPVVVAVHGSVAGAGLGIVMAADIAIAAPGSTFLMAYTKIGLTPDGATKLVSTAHRRTSPLTRSHVDESFTRRPRGTRVGFGESRRRRRRGGSGRIGRP